MKSLICSIVVFVVAISSLGQPVPPHEWKATVTVVDETAQPVTGADVRVIFSTFTPEGKPVSTNISGLSDGNGIFRASSVYTGAPDMLFRASKAGFYRTSKPYDLGDYYSVGRWNPEAQLVLKKVGNPTAMYVKRIDAQPPATGKPVSFDLMVGDWVAPYGAGQTSDLLFLAQYTRRSPLDYDGKLTIGFSNPGDGIQEFTVEPDQGGSDLRSPHEAPASGYLPKVERVNISHPPEPAKCDYDPNRQYFFRVRTVLDEKGNVKSAFYGKIYGDFMHFTYYLNPTPNDRNVEFDPGRNLIAGQDGTGP
jgi:hypothetical protein